MTYPHQEWINAGTVVALVVMLSADSIAISSMAMGFNLALGVVSGLRMFVKY